MLAGDARLAAQGWGLLTALVLDDAGTPAGCTRIFAINARLGFRAIEAMHVLEANLAQ